MLKVFDKLLYFAPILYWPFTSFWNNLKSYPLVLSAMLLLVLVYSFFTTSSLEVFSFELFSFELFSEFVLKSESILLNLFSKGLLSKGLLSRLELLLKFGIVTLLVIFLLRVLQILMLLKLLI